MFSIHIKTLLSIGITSSIRDEYLKDKVGNIFGEIGLNVNDRDIQVCHRLREGDCKIC